MTIKHIEDQIKSVCLEVARDAYLQGMKDYQLVQSGLPTPTGDDLHDMLESIIEKQLKGTHE